MKIAGVYLAAGKSIRMGRKKLALPIRTTTIGSMALREAVHSSLTQIYIVSNGDHTWVDQDLLTNKKCTFIPCPTASLGQSESLKWGVKHAAEEKMDAIIVLLADQPLIFTKIIDQLIIDFKNKPSLDYVSTSINGMIMPPILFSSTMFSKMESLEGDKGAKVLLKDKSLQGKKLISGNQMYFFDVDTEEDYRKLLSYSNKSFEKGDDHC
ncbi:NTP transferase domain-containing protein [Lederbergia ruris]|uniref:Xanthine dehydrogenase accessory protein PucB n=1 Tax=Lederbergia ruris TaxID=217495 RepID=A0ABQ4KN25_9BACI|nr:nucleotidyltransferase family protein [Lederbergia ruris]GIN59335.1 xanthine dehydrogenase accessory protein PucB [Lederbergia ruris]